MQIVSRLTLIAGIVGCGGASSDVTTLDATPPLTDAASTPARIQAAQQTAMQNAACIGIGPFYWEIGDVHGAIASGANGTMYTATTSMDIASGSKWLWGAYNVQRFASDLTKIDIKAMTMRSGYTSFDACPIALTVQGCFQQGTNSQYTAANDGRFFYNGGHFQKQAVDLGFGAYGNNKLADGVKQYLGDDLAFSYDFPALAAGVMTTSAAYGAFLRKVLSGSLAIGAHLGEQAVCTLPASCPNAVSSPVPEAWHYSYGHWVEDAPDTGDGAFSSPGYYGFYPWIDQTKTYYGIVARKASGDAAYWDSVLCGRQIRKAFVTATPQL
jgi:hypothetical protein